MLAVVLLVNERAMEHIVRIAVKRTESSFWLLYV